VFLSVNNHDKPALLPIARRLRELGFDLLGTRGTALYLFDNGMPCQLIYKVGEGTPDIAGAIHTGQVQVVVNTPLGQTSYFDDKAIRVAASSRGVPCITTLSAAEAAVDALERSRGAGMRRFAVQD
jgi:carbamoyl-phosphate synthase large subunit